MDLTDKLLKVFLVEKQLFGLRSRLEDADKFLAVQNKEVGGLSTQGSTLESQLKTYTAQAADFEGEMARLDAKMATLRSQMENAQTNKEYKAFLSEINTFKADRDQLETKALELMTKSDAVRTQLAETSDKRKEREQVKDKAVSDREARFKEIEGRVNELEAERTRLAAEVPADTMAMFNRLLKQRRENAMGPVEIQDHKRHEYTCGVCMMTIPVESVSGLMANGKLTRCKSCECVLYLEDESKKVMTAAAEKVAAKRAKSAS